MIPSTAKSRLPSGAVRTASVIGTGSFAQRVLIPGLCAAGFKLDTIASASGLSAYATVERKPDARTGSPEDALASDAGLLVIATRHSSHAELAALGLHAGKSVFVEKPPCLTDAELELLREARSASGRELVVGFNRRHAPLAIRMRDHVAADGHPRQLLIRVNAGHLPVDHWINDPHEGGGRLVGEGCHFVDMACWLVGGLPTATHATVHPMSQETIQTAQRFSISLGFADGSTATIVYTDQGANALEKELVEVHAGGRSAVLHDFRSLELFNGRSREQVRERRPDKGHTAQLAHLRRRRAGDEMPAELDPLDSMAVTLAALESAHASVDSQGRRPRDT
jgi:predicted dehydrogenase